MFDTREFFYTSLQVPSPKDMRRRVLIADDNETMRSLGRSKIEKMEGVDVGVAVTNGIEAGEAKILIDPFLSDNPSWDNGWSGYLTGRNSTQGGDR
jgi:hypothetical protein